MRKHLPLLLAAIMLLGLLVGFAPQHVAAEGPAADVPADRYDATTTPRTGTNATKPLVMNTGTLDGKFSPFFYTSAYDGAVEELTQIGLLHLDKKASPVAGVEWPCLAYSFTQDVSEDETVTNYNIILKNGIVFSDGEPVTVEDVLFSIYVLCDPAFDGISGFYTNKVKGMTEYRLQTNTEQLETVAKMLEAGIEAKEDGGFTINPVEGVDPAVQETFWGYTDEAGQQFAQEIIDYVVNKYGAKVDKYFEPYTIDELKESSTLQAAYGMAMWGFGELKEGEPEIFVDSTGAEFNLKEDEVTAETYWKNLLAGYGYDLSDAGVNAEAAGSMKVQDYLKEVYIAKEGQVEGGVQNIVGITTGTTECEDGVEREFINLECEGIDPTAIFRMGISVVPKHYYTDGYEGELNENGVAVGNPEFMTFLKTKNGHPMGAGPYVFQDWKDKVVTYKANDLYLMGSPKIANLRYQEIPLGGELDALKTETIYYGDPSATKEIVNDISGGAEGYEHLGYTLVDNDGYGYIGIQGQAFPDWNVRKALAHAMNVGLAVEDYYGELASVNYRTMTKVQWAYPDNPEALYPYDGSGETSKALLLEAGFIYNEAENTMLWPEGSENAGKQLSIKFTLPSEAKDHPAGSIAIDLQKVLEKIGVKLEIEVDSNLLGKLSNGYEAGINLWAAAWGSGGSDPDMFQIWYSDPAVNKADSPKGRGTSWLFQNGSDDQKAALTELNELIMAGRSTLDKEERREIYARALELSTGMAVEVPTYQRKNMFVYNKNVINVDTLLSGEEVTPFQSPLGRIWEVELLGD